MSKQTFTREASDSTRKSDRMSDRTTEAAKNAFSSASTMAEDAAEKVKQAASETASTLTGEVKDLLNRQVSGGADMLGCVAQSAKRAAEDLDRDSPQIAGLINTAAVQVERYADNLRNRSVDQLWQTASDFTRRQPALVFGFAALAGFFALRTLKSSPSIAAPPIQPSSHS